MVAGDEAQEEPEEPPLRAKFVSVPEMEQPKEKKSQKTLFRHNYLCVCVCLPSLLRIES